MYVNYCLTRWSLLLQDYNLIIKHIRGTDDDVADVLSRIPVSHESTSG